jgi:hypothetical protein
MIMRALSVKSPWAELIASGAKTIETRRWTTKYRGPVLIVCSLSPKTEMSGLAVCTARIVDCKPMTKNDELDACCEVYPDANSWFLEDIVEIAKPFPVKGQLGLFNVDVTGLLQDVS